MAAVRLNSVRAIPIASVQFFLATANLTQTRAVVSGLSVKAVSASVRLRIPHVASICAPTLKVIRETAGLAGIVATAGVVVAASAFAPLDLLFAVTVVVLRHRDAVTALVRTSRLMPTIAEVAGTNAARVYLASLVCASVRRDNLGAM